LKFLYGNLFTEYKKTTLQKENILIRRKLK